MLLQIETQRTLLRLLSEEDLNLVAELNSDPDVRKYFPDGVQSKEQTQQRIRQLIGFYKEYGLPCFVIFNKESNEFIGRCGFGLIETGEIEVGYLIARKFWGMNYASEALKGLLNWSKNNIKTDFIIAFAPLEHKASHRVMEKCGMHFYKEDIGHGIECKFYRIKNSD
ncbi:GNAT family N-acetyltransferase [Legionella bononiensis]|uniref:GNAT family N-acetyltransferase n=1 Tax=Legionella bononiensis TaxID=2793102 RepID=A0ABS1W6J5_9GAMM|nr:GNAT family N-acetyltransferase [Legionella bononiensis]MBL7478390.1 GNAT family N-acetyltransferase [Legionella bononiensis]MBL7524987.1 GNAT family N-acetyltransferase [Legionella bononiensis]MBL7561284.1 GNAT family N-acetyltransferase [Legionella bononiensis]